MNGYVKNKSAAWRHAMKRTVGPGHKIELDELFEQYGEKHGLQEGSQFVEWLRSVKLKDISVWEVVYTEDKKRGPKVKKDSKLNTNVGKVKTEGVKSGIVSPIVAEPMEVSDITKLSVREARDELKTITDIKLLKYALLEANQLAKKDTLCIMLRKRISEVEITRR